jgi:hypothetical protein
LFLGSALNFHSANITLYNPIDSSLKPLLHSLPACASWDQILAYLSLWMQVGRAHGLLANLFRISKELPAPLRPQGLTEGRYAPILFDYRYFKEKTAMEARIEASTELQQLDDHFREVACHISAP